MYGTVRGFYVGEKGSFLLTFHSQSVAPISLACCTKSQNEPRKANSGDTEVVCSKEDETPPQKQKEPRPCRMQLHSQYRQRNLIIVPQRATSTMFGNLKKWATSAWSNPSSENKPATTSTPNIWCPPHWDMLLGAAQTDRPWEIMQLVKMDGVSPNHANRVGQTALHISALLGHADCVSLLVSKDIGANPNLRNLLTGATPLHLAIQGNKIREASRLNLIVDILLQAGADKNLADDWGRVPADYITSNTPGAEMIWYKLQPRPPPIFQAIGTGDFSRVLFLFYSGQESPHALARQVYRNCTTVQATVDLMVSVADPFAPLDEVFQADLDLLRILLTCGASPSHLQGNEANRELFHADQSNEELTMSPMLRLLDCVQEALSKLEKEKTVTKDCSPSLLPPIVRLWLEACQALQERHEQDEMMTVMATEKKRQEPPLLTTEDISRYWHNAARRGQLVFLQALLRYLPTLFDANSVNRQGMTALHFASRSGQTHVAAYLLSLPQIQVNLVDNHGQSVLDAALVNGHMDIVELLRDRHAQSSGRNSCRNGPINSIALHQ